MESCKRHFYLALPLLLPLAIGGETLTTSHPCSVSALHGWKACRLPPRDDPSMECPPENTFDVPSLPTTALIVLLDNNAVPGIDFPSDELYRSDNLKRIPDIHEVGREVYTLRYEWQVPSLEDDDHRCRDVMNVTRRTLRFAGVNYQVSAAYVDGKEVLELGPDGGTAGAFRRRSYPLPTSSSRFGIVVEPPYHPGSPTCPGNATEPCTQGGDHSLAMDGPTPQYMLGWNWCQPMPDRATGFYGNVMLKSTGDAAILDPAVQSVRLDCSEEEEERKEWRCSSVELRLLARIECAGKKCSGDRPAELHVESDWGERWTIPVELSGMTTDVEVDVRVAMPGEVRLWWPHGIGIDDVAHLASFAFSIRLDEDSVSDVKVLRTGIRTVDTYLDASTQGQKFAINGKDLFLTGGNWIGSDQAFRFSASKERYRHELLLHRHAGLNLIRVWGGSTAETDEFYDCADELGLLVYQEFWMTGDNNGRWAGEYSWPLDHDVYLRNAQDTVRRLRSHPSLLFYGGCNECAAPRDNPWGPNPPFDIDAGIRNALRKYDPDRFYVPSSMGGKNKSDKFVDRTVWFNRSYSLSFSDGPYGMLPPSTFFERNPGLGYPDVPIGFQPEIGSVTAPSYEGLLRFMTPREAEEGFPSVDGTVGEVWRFHKFKDWTTGDYDHVRAYFGPDGPRNAEEWCAGAALASHRQYHDLLNGFASHIFEWYNAIVLWKSQSPWPELGSYLYDWYLGQTGAFRGVRAALSEPTAVALDMKSWRVRMINRSIHPFRRTDNGGSIGAAFAWVSMDGTIAAEGRLASNRASIGPMSAALLGDGPLAWPEGCSEVCFLRLTTLPPSTGKSSNVWYWLTDPELGVESDYSPLGEARRRQGGRATLAPVDCRVVGTSSRTEERSLVVTVAVEVPSDASEVLFYPTYSLYTAQGEPLLPLLDRGDVDLVLLPGERQVRELVQPVTHVDQNAILEVVLETWNGGKIRRSVICGAGDAAPE